MMPVPDLAPALPELFLAFCALALLVVGVVKGEGSMRLVSWLAILVLIVDLALVLDGPTARTVTFAGLFVTDAFARFMKVLIVTGSAASILLSMQYNEQNGIARFEYPVLILLATTGMLGMVSANDLISLYVALELQSLSLYVLASFKRDTVRSTEAGLKYFVLGALSSGMMLFGSSFIYGFAGTTSFDGLAQILSGAGAVSLGLIIGIVFLSVGLAFKCSAVPFHMWTPDVYEGAPTPVTAFFAVAPKIAALSLFLRVMIEPLGHLAAQWSQIVWAISFLSMALGSYAAISQRNIKRLMAYSSIGHVGYALIGLATGTQAGVAGMLIYLTIYLFMSLGTFGVILCMERSGQSVEQIADLAGLSKTRPGIALAMCVFMFSMAGIPPLGGFWSKWFIFSAAIQGHFDWLAVLGVLTSVIGAFYYLRVIKVMYFDEPVAALDPQAGGPLVRGVIFVGAVAVVLVLFVLNPVSTSAQTAAAALFLG